MARRVTALLAVGLLGFLASGCGGHEARPERVVLVSIDTLRADHVGCYGAARAHTPTLDGLAARGWRYPVALSPAPLTLPSHTTLLTGLDPDRHGVRHNSVFKLAPGIPTLAEHLHGAGFATAAFVGAFVLDHRFGLARGFEVYDDHMGSRRSATVGFAERRAADVVDAALAWADHAPPRFFVWVHFYDAHARYDPPPGFSMLFPGDPYAGEIAYVDAELGRLLAGLARRFDPERTLVVVTADHGESLGEHGELSHSYSVYEATQRIPLILSGPGFRGGRVVHTMARLSDVAPTLLAAVGAAPLPGPTGRDLAAGKPPAEPAWAETLATHLDFGWSALFSARTDRWQYIRAPKPELYDLAADPRETRNVAAEHPDVDHELGTWIARRLAAAKPVTAEDALSAADRARLQALGYVVPAPAAAGDDLSGPDPKDHRDLLAAIGRADALADAGRPADAYRVLAGVSGGGPMLHALRAADAVNGGLAEIAAREIRVAIAAEPGRSDYLLVLGLAEEQLGHADAAADAYRRTTAVDPTSAPAWLGLGRLAEAAGDAKAAARSYSRALEGEPPEPEAAWRLATLRFEAGDSAAARTLLARDPEAPDLSVALRAADAERRAGNPAAAAARLEAALDEHPAPTALASTAAALLEAGGRLEAALRVREAALAAEPSAWQRENEVAWTLALLDRQLERARSLAESAARGSGEAPEVLDTLATVRWRQGEAAGALAVADRSLKRTPAALQGHVRYVRAACLAALGRSSEAHAEAHRALAAPVQPGDGLWRDAARALAEGSSAAAARP